MHSIRLLQKGVNSDEFASELILLGFNEEKKAPSNFSCIILGVPSGMMLDEFETFIEPFKPECESYELVTEDQSIYVSSVEAKCKMALISFQNESSYHTFCSLYNNLHFPSYRSNPPCLTIPIVIERVEHASEFLRESSGEQLQGNDVSKEKCALLGHSSSSLLSSSSTSTSLTKSKTRRIPSCTVCLRRMKASVTHIPGSNDIPVHTKFGGNGARCLVCRIYGGSHSIETDQGKRDGEKTPAVSSLDSSSSVATDVTKLRRCLTCDLRDNIWVCMVCAHTGCGRYTCQHAQHHFEQSGHPFSLELASGRIWDYDYDTFVHVERGPLEDMLHSPRGKVGGEIYGGSDTSSALAGGKAIELSQPNTARSDSDAGTPREKSEWFRLRSASFEEMSRAQAVHGLGTEVRDKIDAIVDRYERLLETQLKQQQQYYEKLLSRETAQAFYASLNPGASASSEVSSLQKIAATECLTDESESNHDWTNAGGLTEDDLNDIVTSKLEISSLEYDNVLLLEKLRDVEAKTKRALRQNDLLVKKHRQHQEKIDALRELAKERHASFEATVTDLEQQIRDLSFYSRTQAQLALSPIRTELEGGQVVGVAPVEPHQPASGTLASAATSASMTSSQDLSNAPSSTSSTAQRPRISSGDGKKRKGGKSPRR